MDRFSVKQQTQSLEIPVPNENSDLIVSCIGANIHLQFLEPNQDLLIRQGVTNFHLHDNNEWPDTNASIPSNLPNISAKLADQSEFRSIDLIC